MSDVSGRLFDRLAIGDAARKRGHEGCIPSFRFAGKRHCEDLLNDASLTGHAIQDCIADFEALCFLWFTHTGHQSIVAGTRDKSIASETSRSRRDITRTSTNNTAQFTNDPDLLTGLLDITGGPFNPFIVMYGTYVWLAGVTLSSRWGLLVAGVSALGFGWLVFDHLQPGGTEHHRLNDFPTHLFTMWLAGAAVAELLAHYVGRQRPRRCSHWRGSNGNTFNGCWRIVQATSRRPRATWAFTADRFSVSWRSTRLRDEHDGRTTLTLRAVPLCATELERETFNDGRKSLQQGFARTFDQLADYLAKA